MSDKEPDTPRTQRIKVAKKEVEEASNYMKNNLLEYFKAMDAIQKKVMSMIEKVKDFAYVNIDDLTLYVKMCSEISDHWRTSKGYYMFSKTVEFYFSIFYPAALNGVTAVKNVCSNFGRIIAAIAIAEGDYYLALRTLSSIIEVYPSDTFSYAMALKWSAFLKEWDIFIHFYDRNRIKSGDNCAYLRDACHLYYRFFTSASDQKTEILNEIEEMKKKLDTGEKTFYSYLSMQILYNVLSAASNMPNYDLSKFTDPGMAIVLESSKGGSIVTSRMKFFEQNAHLNLYNCEKGLPDGYLFLKTVSSIADYYESEHRCFTYMNECGIGRDAESRILLMVYNGLKLVSPYRLLISFSELYHMKSKTLIDRQKLKGLAACIALLFSNLSDDDKDDTNSRKSLLAGNYVTLPPSDSESVLKPIPDEHGITISRHPLKCKCWTCLFSKDNGNFVTAMFFVEYLLNPSTKAYTKFESSIRNVSVVTRSREQVIKTTGCTVTEKTSLYFQYCYYLCLATMKYLLETPELDSKTKERLCNNVIMTAGSSLELRYFWLLARQLKRIRYSESDYPWLQNDSEEMLIKCFSSLQIRRNPLQDHRDDVTKARADFKSYQHLFYSEWRYRICEYLGAFLAEQFPWYSAWYFVESRSSSLRQSVRMHKVNPSDMRFDGVQAFKDFVRNIPDDMSVIHLILDDQKVLWLVRIDCDSRPLVIPIRKIEHENDPIVKGMVNVLVTNDSSVATPTTSTIAFWRGRQMVEKSLKKLLHDMEEIWISFFRPLLVPTGKFGPQMVELLHELRSKLVNAGYCEDHAQVLSHIYLHASKEDFQALLNIFASLQSNRAKMTTDSFQKDLLKEIAKFAIPTDIMEEYNSGDKYTLLILSPDLNCYPWEYLSLYEKSPYVLRMQSLHFLKRTIDNYCFPHVVDAKNAYYLLNPGNDLPVTEQRIKDALDLSALEGAVKDCPSKKEIAEILRKKDLFIYIGHGSGSRHFGSTSVRDSNCRAVAILMGCSSVRLIHEGRGYDGLCPAHNYAISGSPCVVGCLWMVTDGEIDKFFIAFTRHCFSELVKENQKNTKQVPLRVLMQALVKARSACRLKYLTGGSVVAFGMPALWIVQAFCKMKHHNNISKTSLQTLTPQEGYSLVSNANTMETVYCGTKFRNLKGMGWIVTCLFIVGETAGGGLIAMPTAMVAAGLWGGIFIIMIGAIMCAYTGNLLSENWTILQQRWPEYRTHCRKPYPAMGLRALGPRFMTVVSSCLNVTQFGTAVVFLLLASKNIESFLRAFGGPEIGFCLLVLVVAAFMLPFTMLKSPKDFWWAVIGAMITTSIAVCLIIYGALSDGNVCMKEVHYPAVVPSRFLMCFGTVMFAYGGHGAFPTIQHDMKKPYNFKKSVYMAFLIIFCMYLPVSVSGYQVYGDSLRDSVIPSLQDMAIQQSVNILITLHVILALTIVFNPLNQELEELLNIPHHFGWQRFTARTAMMAAVVVVAETVPNFGVLLDLVGGSTITLMALVFPVIFNFFTAAGNTKYDGAAATKDEQPLSFTEAIRYTPKLKLAIFAFILAFALVGGGTASLTALSTMLNSQFSQPCYAWVWTPSDTLGNLTTGAHHSGVLHCCGINKNIAVYGNTSICLDPSVSLSSGSHG